MPRLAALLALLTTAGRTAGTSKYECTYLTPHDHVPTAVHRFNGSMLVHSSLQLGLTVALRVINTSTAVPPLLAKTSGLRGTYYVPTIFSKRFPT